MTSWCTTRVFPVAEQPAQQREILTNHTEKWWRVNSQGKSKHKSELCDDDCTYNWVLQAFWLPIEPFYEYEEKYKIKKEAIVCIAWADSHLWKMLKSTNNIGNVWNNDRWDVVHFATIEQGIEAMFRVLNNRYLGNYQRLWELSQWWRTNLWLKPCTDRWEFCYATSKENWNNNVLNCLNTIKDTSIDENWNFRISQ